MITCHLPSLLLALSVILSAQAQPPQSLFDGKTLDGWGGNPDFWRVENGCIIGETTTAKPTKGNTFLIWKGGELTDFELTLKARVIGNNSGIQYRSKIVNPASWAVGGYQMDLIGNDHLFAMLYEERGRGILAQRGQRVVLRADKKPEVIGSFDRSQPLDVAAWNEYTVIARGRQLTHKVNGAVTIEAIDDDVAKRAMSGVLAIQLHAGPPTRVEVKEIVLKPLPPAAAQPAAAKPAATSTAKPQWIWPTKAASDEVIYARRSWTQSTAVKSATLRVACDNGYTAYLNGKTIGEGSNWAQPQTFDVTPHLLKGENILAIEASNQGNMAGLIAQLDITDASGTVTHLTTDANWQVSRKPASNWMKPDTKIDWPAPFVHGPMGIPPWGDVFAGKPSAAAPKTAAKPAAKATAPSKKPGPMVNQVLDGFEADLIYTVPKDTQGSWVAMGVDDKGRLYGCDQRDKGLFRVTLGADGAAPLVEKVPVELSGAQGLLWAHGALYAGLNTSRPTAGLYRISDSNGDDVLDKVEQLREMRQGGEHGIHGVVLAPDGESLYIAGGNHSPTPSPTSSAVPLNYGEDQWLPSMIDSRGHAKGVKAPGGWMAKLDREGTTAHLVAAGFRNQYDMAFTAEGELFTYDSDMEWDNGTPWYRPTRMYHVTSGSEFGWRTGSGKFPDWYPDTLPPALDVGPGSPTGVLSGLGARFPAKYQHAIFAFDWTYGTIYAMHPVPNGSSYTMVKEEFLSGTPLNLTDGVIGKDGNMYFAVGGRGGHSAVFRVRYTGDESTAPAPAPTDNNAPLRELRRSLEALHQPVRENPEAALNTIWAQLGHSDRFIRFAARVALEHQPVASWQERALAEADPQAALSALLALARQGATELQPRLLSRLTHWLGQTLKEAQKLEALRVLGLTAIRMGEPNAETAASLAALLSPGYPAATDALNRELAATLVALKAPDVVAKTVPLLSQEAAGSETLAIDDALLARSGSGHTFTIKEEANPQRQQIWYAHVLRSMETGWTPKLREDYFTWFAKARGFKGGASFGGFIDNARKEALTKIPDEAERSRLEALSQKAVRSIPEGYESARKITVGVKPGLKFDTDLIQARAGEKLAIEFINNDPLGMMHNLAIAKAGSLQTVLSAAVNMGPKAIEKNFIPDIPEVLGSTPQVAPGRKFVLYITAPQAGQHHFICTYPGHGQLMNGTFDIAE